jgi:hypothetical protein
MVDHPNLKPLSILLNYKFDIFGYYQVRNYGPSFNELN